MKAQLLLDSYELVELRCLLLTYLRDAASAYQRDRLHAVWGPHWKRRIHETGALYRQVRQAQARLRGKLA